MDAFFLVFILFIILKANGAQFGHPGSSYEISSNEFRLEFMLFGSEIALKALQLAHQYRTFYTPPLSSSSWKSLWFGTCCKVLLSFLLVNKIYWTWISATLNFVRSSEEKQKKQPTHPPAITKKKNLNKHNKNTPYLSYIVYFIFRFRVVFNFFDLKFERKKTSSRQID